MRKGLSLVAVLSVLLLTGCSTDKLTCTNTQDVGSAKLESKITITFKNGYATQSDTVMTATFSSDTVAKTFADSYAGKEDYEVKQNGKVVTVKNTTTVSKDEAKADENKKENVKKSLEEAGLTCK